MDHMEQREGSGKKNSKTYKIDYVYAYDRVWKIKFFTNFLCYVHNVC